MRGLLQEAGEDGAGRAEDEADEAAKNRAGGARRAGDKAVEVPMLHGEGVAETEWLLLRGLKDHRQVLRLLLPLQVLIEKENTPRTRWLKPKNVVEV